MKNLKPHTDNGPVETSKTPQNGEKATQTNKSKTKWLAYVAAGAATTATLSATHTEVCADINVSNPNVSLFASAVMPGEIIATSFPGVRARFSTSLNGNGDIVLSAIHPPGSVGFGFGRVFGQAGNGARFFGNQEEFPFTTFAGGSSVTRLNFPANAALGARFSTLQTRSQQLSGRSFTTGFGANSFRSILADPLGAEARQFHQFGQTYLSTAPASQDAFLAFTFDDAAGEDQFGFIRLSLGTPGLTVGAPPGFLFGLNGVIVEQVAFTTEGQLDLDRGFAVGVLAVPEPSSLAVLALGAMGVAAWRRKRQVDIDSTDKTNSPNA